MTVLSEPADCRARAQRGKFLMVHFEMFVDESSAFGVPGTLKHSSYQNGLPIDIELSVASIIPGWVIGLNGQCEGAKVKLVVPPHLGEVCILTLVNEKVVKANLWCKYHTESAL